MNRIYDLNVTHANYVIYLPLYIYINIYIYNLLLETNYLYQF